MVFTLDQFDPNTDCVGCTHVDISQSHYFMLPINIIEELRNNLRENREFETIVIADENFTNCIHISKVDNRIKFYIEQKIKYTNQFTFFVSQDEIMNALISF